jgi:hypothetical protein
MNKLEMFNELQSNAAKENKAEREKILSSMTNEEIDILLRTAHHTNYKIWLSSFKKKEHK